MNLISFKKFLLEVKISKTKLDYHQVLNPKLWTEDNNLIPKVKEQIKKIADTFIETLDIEKSFIKDVVFTGSNTNFNYTDQSDIDIHISVDFSKFKGKIKPDDYFDAMKSNWNLTHEIKIYEHDVEIYVNDKKENLVGDSSAYSITNDKWIKEPKLQVVKYPNSMIKLKAEHLANLIDKQIKLHHNDKQDLEKLNEKIGKMRRAGLTRQGEFSLENLTFKALRNNGYVDKLRKQIKKAEDSKLNLEGTNMLVHDIYELYKKKLNEKELYEVNYGSLEKDKRLITIRNLIVSDMIKVISRSTERNQWIGKIDISINTKYKSPSKKNITIEWLFKNSGLYGSINDDLIWRAKFYSDQDKHVNFGIALEYIQVKNLSYEKFRDKIIDFISNTHESDATILHEIKHLLDKIDQIFPENLSDREIENMSRDENYYIHPTEKDSFLITVLKEIEGIHDKTLNISYEDAIKKSNHYNIMINKLSGKDLNKFKQKVAYFWNSYISKNKNYNESKYLKISETIKGE